MTTDISSFFKSYDIRGTYPQINEEIYYWIGQGILLQVLLPENLGKKFVLTHDCRLSSPNLYKAFAQGFVDAGGEIVGLGISSTDYLYAATQKLQIPGGIITASHNPKDDNGIKIVKKEAEMLGLGSGLEKVRDFVLEKIGSKTVKVSDLSEVVLNSEAKALVDNYFLQKIKEIGQVDSVNQILSLRGEKIKIAVDAGNGMGGWVMSNFVKDLYPNIEFVPLYWEPDGNYPNHPANPQEYKNLIDLQTLMDGDKSITMGAAFDGDGDRVVILDENGEVVEGDFLVAFFAKTLLKNYFQNPITGVKPAVVFLQPGSLCVAEAIVKADGILIPSKQGHTHIKAKMTFEKALYGGEFSGHHYFASFGNMDSGVLTLVLMIQILIEKNTKISRIFESLRKYYFISELQTIYFDNGLTFDTIKERLINYFNDAEISFLDGVSVFYQDWKFSIRPSGTEPLVRFILETRGTDRVKEKLDLVRKVVSGELVK